jgi:hypothetical protein
MMSVWERNLYSLAERLSTPVYKLKAEMPFSEMLGWMQFLSDDKKPAFDVEDPDSILRGFGLGPATHR